MRRVGDVDVSRVSASWTRRIRELLYADKCSPRSVASATSEARALHGLDVETDLAEIIRIGRTLRGPALGLTSSRRAHEKL
jgi:hypothetical protein